MIEQWRAHELNFTCENEYADPFREAELTVTFTHESGETLVRPGFWNGGKEFAVRFAPTLAGLWRWKSVCSDRSDKGLHGLEGTLECVPYTGKLALYRHGFLKVSDNHRYFTYADGTPFFYLGDTHWLMPKEQWACSNVTGIDSEFRFLVDLRLTQGFTVYQSEPIGTGAKFVSGTVSEEDVQAFKSNEDLKYRYIADAGLVHACAELCFARELQERRFTPEFLVKLSRMWVARFGAYPVLWTLAQEVDPDFYGHADVSKWPIVGETLAQYDAYHHPLTAHMCNDSKVHPNNTAYGDKYYHDWFGMQAQGGSRMGYREFYDYKITKPLVNYETGYEHLWNTTEGAVGAGWRAYFNGACGYGYGAHGVWNDNRSIDSWMDYDGYMRWFEGALQPGAGHLYHLRTFLSAFPWTHLVPRFEDTAWWEPCELTVLAVTETAYFVYHAGKPGEKIVLKQAQDQPYRLYSFNVITGTLTETGTVTPENGIFTVSRTDKEPCVLIASLVPFVLPLSVEAENDKTLLIFRGDTVRLHADRPVTWSVTDGASIDENGLLTAQGQNGFVTVTATAKSGETAQRKFLLVRQSETSAPAKAEKITARVNYCGKSVTTVERRNDNRYITVLPEFTPADAWTQYPELHISDLEGNPTKRVLMGRNYLLNPCSDAEILVWFTQDKLESEKVKVTFTGYGKPSVFEDAFATCDDWHEKYDPRCLPERAISGETKRFSGWCSEKRCSFDDPAVLTIIPKTPVRINHIDLYTTDIGYMLCSFDLLAVVDGKERVLAEVRNNSALMLPFDFDEITVEKVMVRCYEGDGEGNARVDEINGYVK